MFTKKSQKARIAVATLLTVLTLGSSASLMADHRLSKNEVREIARRNGYRLGFREGRFDSRRGGRSDYGFRESRFDDRFDERSDVQRHRRFDFRNSQVYRDGRAGYRSEFGYERDYRNAFRDAFEDGYRAAFNGGGRRGDHRDDRWDDRRDDRWDDRRETGYPWGNRY